MPSVQYPPYSAPAMIAALQLQGMSVEQIAAASGLRPKVVSSLGAGVRGRYATFDNFVAIRQAYNAALATQMRPDDEDAPLIWRRPE